MVTLLEIVVYTVLKIVEGATPKPPHVIAITVYHAETM